MQFSSVRTVLWGGFSLVLLAGGYLVARPKPALPQGAPAIEQGAASAMPLKTFSLRVASKNGAPASPVFRVGERDEVEIDVKSDQAGLLMLHGYSDGVPVAKDGEAKIRFTATHTGRFPLHMHAAAGSHLELATLEVLPRN